MRKLFFKVYQDRNNMNNYYVETIDNVKDLCNMVQIGDLDEDTGIPVFEPIFMEQEEFENLPEFEGF